MASALKRARTRSEEVSDGEAETDVYDRGAGPYDVDGPRDGRDAGAIHISLVPESGWPHPILSSGINVSVASLGLCARTCERYHGLFSPGSRPTASSQTLSANPTGLRARWACGLMVLGTTKCLHETWDGRFSSASRSPWSLRRAKWPSARIGLPMATSLSYPSDSIASHDLVQPRFS